MRKTSIVKRKQTMLNSKKISSLAIKSSKAPSCMPFVDDVGVDSVHTVFKKLTKQNKIPNKVLKEISRIESIGWNFRGRKHKSLTEEINDNRNDNNSFSAKNKFISNSSSSFNNNIKERERERNQNYKDNEMISVFGEESSDIEQLIGGNKYRHNLLKKLSKKKL